jgi:septal ring factor EnvC (AmiA/AmiB activator)
MATTQDKITALEEDIKELNAERKAAVGDERIKLLDAITAARNNLDRLYTQLEREQQQQQCMSLTLFMIFIRHLPPFLTIV